MKLIKYYRTEQLEKLLLHPTRIRDSFHNMHGIRSLAFYYHDADMT